MRRKSITMKGESWMSPWLLCPPNRFVQGPFVGRLPEPGSQGKEKELISLAAGQGGPRDRSFVIRPRH